jgi:hypothetical protein
MTKIVPWSITEASWYQSITAHKTVKNIDRRKDGCIANDFVDYIDGIRQYGNGVNAKEAEEEMYRVTCCITSVINYLGMQDAPRILEMMPPTPHTWCLEQLYAGDKQRWCVLKSISGTMGQDLWHDSGDTGWSNNIWIC